MTYDIGELIFRLPLQERRIVRNLERSEKKLTNAKHAVQFNKTCISERLLPTFSNIRLHDHAIKEEQFTTEFRVKLVERQLFEKEKTVKKLEVEQTEAYCAFQTLNIDTCLRIDITDALQEKARSYKEVCGTRIAKKLNKLYGGKVDLPIKTDAYLNLSSKELSNDQKDFLNLGLNFHMHSRHSPYQKNTELELLFQSVIKLQKAGKVNINHALRPQLLAEGTIHRKGRLTGVVTPKFRAAAKQLREDEDIIIRKADKSSVYVILDRKDYNDKLDTILSDESKFKRITKDPTSEVKKEANRLITAANAENGGVHFKKIVGEYKPGYLYGNVKVHKDGNPLRPIISQVPTPTYELAKELNKVIQPYIPVASTLQSTDEFVDLLKCTKPQGILASLDVESLFTNVPVEDTIEIILRYVFHNPDLSPPRVPRKVIEGMLRICTTKSPFISPVGILYQQIDGVAMGSPLGVLFANAYMCHVEDVVLKRHHPFIYRRYVDDIYVEVQDTDALNDLKSTMETASVLKFTTEIGLGHSLSFLDVSINVSDGQHHEMSVHRKQTNGGHCLNAASECPERYKRGVIKYYDTGT